MQCPKCHGLMQTYNRSGVQIEQCGGCRGIFLDYGELEALTRLEGQWAQQVPPAAPPMQAPPGAAYPAAPGGDAAELLAVACDPDAVGEADADNLADAVRVGRAALRLAN